MSKTSDLVIDDLNKRKRKSCFKKRLWFMPKDFKFLLPTETIDWVVIGFTIGVLFTMIMINLVGF